MTEKTTAETREMLAKDLKNKEVNLEVARNMLEIGSTRVGRKVPEASKAADEARRKLEDHDAKFGSA